MSGVLQSVFMNMRSFITPPNIGDAYEGGFFAGQISTTADGVATHNLVVAPLATGQSTLKWKTSSSSTAGTSSVIDGPTNSSNMNNATHPAAQFCEALTIGGYTDWYMPARNELIVEYYFLKPTTVSNNTGHGSNAYAVSPEPISTNYSSGSPAQTSATIFQTGNSEAFSDTNWWSSTTYNATNAWRQYFGNGFQFVNYKTSLFYVRAVRRVAI